MPNVCAIFTHFASQERTLTGLARLAQQTRKPDSIIVINNGRADDPTLEAARAFAAAHFEADTLHILQMEANLGNAGGCARGMQHAFGVLKADLVWVLDDDSWPRPATLAELLAVPADAMCVRMSLVIDPSRGDELSWPLTARPAHSPAEAWQHYQKCEDLPAGNEIISRGGWLGALYPRQAWKLVGVPTEELFIRGEDEEYPWRLRDAGFHFITVRNSPLEHPSSARELIHYSFGGRSFFYEPGLHVSRIYYKNRNWAWLQRLRYPRRYLLRLANCGFYIVLSLNAMLRCGDISVPRIYQLFRALHNGFYGKLRPYE